MIGFLPSSGELQQEHQNLYLSGLGNLNGVATYWSSTQNNGINAQAVGMGSGNVVHQGKAYQYYHVRAILRF